MSSYSHFIYISRISRACYITWSSQSSWLCHPNNIIDKKYKLIKGLLIAFLRIMPFASWHKLRLLLSHTLYLCKMVGAPCFLHEDYDDIIRTSCHVYTTIALSDMSTYILPRPYNAFSRRYSCVFLPFSLSLASSTSLFQSRFPADWNLTVSPSRGVNPLVVVSARRRFDLNV
jgi:hypothetical protein